MLRVKERLKMVVPVTLALIFVLLYMNLKALSQFVWRGDPSSPMGYIFSPDYGATWIAPEIAIGSLPYGIVADDKWVHVLAEPGIYVRRASPQRPRFTSSEQQYSNKSRGPSQSLQRFPPPEKPQRRAPRRHGKAQETVAV